MVQSSSGCSPGAPAAPLTLQQVAHGLSTHSGGKPWEATGCRSGGCLAMAVLASAQPACCHGGTS
eukprot:7968170-Alexandrium_andersonii.AAC.1